MSVQNILDRWRNRPARERWLIGVPAAVLLAVVLYIGAWEPLRGATDRLRVRLPEQTARREQVRAQIAELRAQPAPAAVPALDIGLVRAAIERRQLAGAQPALEPAGQNRTRLAFARAPFHAIWPLLQDLQTERGIRLLSLRLDRQDAGNVRFEAILGTGER